MCAVVYYTHENRDRSPFTGAINHIVYVPEPSYNDPVARLLGDDDEFITIRITIIVIIIIVVEVEVVVVVLKVTRKSINNNNCDQTVKNFRFFADHLSTRRTRLPQTPVT